MTQRDLKLFIARNAISQRYTKHSMEKSCTECSAQFEITDDDLEFLKQFDVPAPQSCPECRLMRRMNERNARKLYYRKCDKTGKEIVSQYHADHPFPVYSTEVWWGDSWDAMEYGMDIDFDKTFFEQYAELRNRVPHIALYVISGSLQNSDFTNCTGYIKNCYLICESDYDEDCYYSNRIYHSNNLLDCSNCFENEVCYEVIDCRKCQRLRFSQDCENCHDSFFLKNCIGCTDCIGCINQRQKRYMIFNEQLTKEEFETRKAALNLHTHSGIDSLREKCDKFFQKQPHKCVQNEHNENCTGDHLYDSKNSFMCLDCKDLEDCRYCAKASMGVRSSMDYTSWGDKAELMYQCSSCGDNTYNLKFCSMCMTNVSDCEYCMQLTGASHMFGCVGVKKREYCILNKQYEKEEYEELKKKLIAHMRETGEYGELPPKEMCAFAYNESIAMEYFPATKEETLARGYKWRDEVDDMPDVEKIIPAEKLPETIEEVPDDVLNWAIRCEKTNRPFRIIQQELNYYRKYNLPIPHLHPDERHERRMKLRPPRKLCGRTCDKCKKEIQSTFSPERPETVYCESCYLNEVY